MLYKDVKKPFPEFKWRWASFTPSEGLNDPRVHLGVLRAMRAHENKSPSSPAFLKSLQLVEDDLNEFLPNGLNLARDNDRNLLRNSQQYWSGVGLLAGTEPGIHLTEFGRKVADGNLTRDEFAAATIRTLCLPNIRIENENVTAKWTQNGLEIFPLTLILNLIYNLGRGNSANAYLTNEELVRVTIPLSSVQATIEEHVEHIILFRNESDIFDDYDDFAPKSNDKRISREFLLFLKYHGYLSISNPNEVNFKQRFFADRNSRRVIKDLLDIKFDSHDLEKIAKEVSNDADLEMQQRERRLVSITARPGQTKFRREVLRASGKKCLLTGETLSVVLRACHIVPVEFDGPDDVGNGICLREDLHILFDSGHLRINSIGEIHLSEHAAESKSYMGLPKKIILPKYINAKCIELRWSYIS